MLLCHTALQSRQYNSFLILILALASGIADLAQLVRMEEQHLAQPFVRIDFGRQGRSVGDFQSCNPPPLRFKWRHVDNDSAARVVRFAYADTYDIAGHTEPFNRPRQGERIGRYYRASGPQLNK